MDRVLWILCDFVLESVAGSPGPTWQPQSSHNRQYRDPARRCYRRADPSNWAKNTYGPLNAGRKVMEARGIEPRSEPRSETAATCVGCA